MDALRIKRVGIDTWRALRGCDCRVGDADEVPRDFVPLARGVGAPLPGGGGVVVAAPRRLRPARGELSPA